jgi:aryl-alcohol dehydrogenase-like predicted oxidoreductase
MDNCWDYNGGASEIRMGKALRDGYRDKVFLMTKIDGRTREAAARQIDESLRRLQTDHLDLLQYHEVIRLEDPDRIFANGGAHEAMADAQKAGKVRHVGFTGHKDPYVHLRMLDAALLARTSTPAAAGAYELFKTSAHFDGRPTTRTGSAERPATLAHSSCDRINSSPATPAKKAIHRNRHSPVR